jgi:hypothetical protein
MTLLSGSGCRGSGVGTRAGAKSWEPEAKGQQPAARSQAREAGVWTRAWSPNHWIPGCLGRWLGSWRQAVLPLPLQPKMVTVSVGKVLHNVACQMTKIKGHRKTMKVKAFWTWTPVE